MRESHISGRSHKLKEAKPLDDQQQQQLYERVEELRAEGKSTREAKRQVADEYGRTVASIGIHYGLRHRALTKPPFPPPKRVNVELRRSQVLACVNKHSRSTTSELFTRTGIPKHSLYKLLNALTDEGAILKRGWSWLPVRPVHYKSRKPIRPTALEHFNQPDNGLVTLRLSVAALEDPEARAAIVRHAR